MTTEVTARRLVELNTCYQRRFGFPFVEWVAGRPADGARGRHGRPAATGSGDRVSGGLRGPGRHRLAIVCVASKARCRRHDAHVPQRHGHVGPRGPRLSRRVDLSRPGPYFLPVRLLHGTRRVSRPDASRSRARAAHRRRAVAKFPRRSSATSCSRPSHGNSDLGTIELIDGEEVAAMLLRLGTDRARRPRRRHLRARRVPCLSTVLGRQPAADRGTRPARVVTPSVDGPRLLRPGSRSWARSGRERPAGHHPPGLVAG